MSTRYASGPLLARLRGVSVPTVHEAIHAGRYGRPLRRGQRGHFVYVDLAAVEAAEGVTFTAEQIAAAAEGMPGRLLTIPEEET